MVCQSYLTRPYLIDGYKFDLRVYVLVTSCDPFRIYVFQGKASLLVVPSFTSRRGPGAVCYDPIRGS